MRDVGVIGCGGISGTHFKGFSQDPRSRVAVVYDENRPAAQEKAAAWGAEAASSAEELVARCDIVVICTPGFAHRHYVELAAAADRHIICEKPIALSIDDARAIESAAESGAGTFLTAFQYRFVPGAATVISLAHSGLIGDTVFAWARVKAPAPSQRWRDIEASGHWRGSAELSGGRITEFCSHAVDWLLWALDRPRSVYGRAMHVTDGFTLDDADTALVDCLGGTGSLDVSRHAGVRKELSLGITGHGGTVEFDGTSVHLTKMDESPVAVPLADQQGLHAHLLDCIEGKAAPATPPATGIAALATCLAFNKSAETNSVQPVLI